MWTGAAETVNFVNQKMDISDLEKLNETHQTLKKENLPSWELKPGHFENTWLSCRIGWVTATVIST